MTTTALAENSDDIVWTLTADLAEGQDDAFNTLMGEMVEATMAEAGTKSYEWHRSGNGPLRQIWLGFWAILHSPEIAVPA